MTLAPGMEITLRVDRLNVRGRGVGRLNGLAVYVDDAVPGDVVRARLTRLTRASAEAEIVRIEEASPDRVTPRCPHVGTCGGCVGQHIDYPGPAAAKKANVMESPPGRGGVSAGAGRPI